MIEVRRSDTRRQEESILFIVRQNPLREREREHNTQKNGGNKNERQNPLEQKRKKEKKEKELFHFPNIYMPTLESKKMKKEKETQVSPIPVHAVQILFVFWFLAPWEASLDSLLFSQGCMAAATSSHCTE